MNASPAPSTPARTAEFPWRRYSSRPIERQVAIPPRCEPPLPNASRARGLSVGVVVKFSQPVTQHSQNDLPDERDTRSAFPYDLSEVDFGAFERECAEKNSSGLLARVIHEALLVRAREFRNCCRVPTASPSTGALSGSLAPAGTG
jgi:hypothetical protein